MMNRVRLSISVRVLMTRCLCLAFVLPIAGCWGNYWGRRPVDQPTPIDPSDPVWIWTRGGVEKKRAVVITQDSVSGIPFQTAPKSVVCPRSIPPGQGDSLKPGYRTPPPTLTHILGAQHLAPLGASGG